MKINTVGGTAQTIARNPKPDAIAEFLTSKMENGTKSSYLVKIIEQKNGLGKHIDVNA
jgi:hypothetical protein